MKRYLFIITFFICAVAPTMAQYYSVNFAKRTVAEMTAAFASEAATEAYYAEQVAKIREYYQAAEVAAAGVFTSKFLDRRALTDLGQCGAMHHQANNVERGRTCIKQFVVVFLET